MEQENSHAISKQNQRFKPRATREPRHIEAQPPREEAGGPKPTNPTEVIVENNGADASKAAAHTAAEKLPEPIELPPINLKPLKPKTVLSEKPLNDGFTPELSVSIEALPPVVKESLTTAIERTHSVSLTETVTETRRIEQAAPAPPVAHPAVLVEPPLISGPAVPAQIEAPKPPLKIDNLIPVSADEKEIVEQVLTYCTSDMDSVKGEKIGLVAFDKMYELTSNIVAYRRAKTITEKVFAEWKQSCRGALLPDDACLWWEGIEELDDLAVAIHGVITDLLAKHSAEVDKLKQQIGDLERGRK